MPFSIFSSFFGGLSGRVSLRLLFIIWIGLTIRAEATAADVRASLSARESYVGDPIMLKLEIEDSNASERPKVPEIDGLEIRALGGPQRLQQTFMINGQVIRRVSTQWNYSVTPTRAGKFEIPEIPVRIDGEEYSTSVLELVASISETGDLLFVEVEGKKAKVYVGEPLAMTLKIWIRPYRDKQVDLTLEESDMWSTISSRTSWGSFQTRVEELANDRKRPRGREVLREDADGTERSYYLYEIETTIYPRRPGQIEASDVNLVFDYPVQMARSRDMMSDLLSPPAFDGDPFGSIFGPRMRITKTRPIEATADVDSTQVLPIPQQGRPDSYQGAVGKYRITAQTATNQTRVGDPITLQLAIRGDGPLELVQAPSLGVLDENFRVDQQPLAGFVQDGAKYFTTTVRPRDVSVTEIPPIEMSFFDPESETFRIVKTEPIPIEVRESETLTLDSIVSGTNTRRDELDHQTMAGTGNRLSLSGLLFRNDGGLQVLEDRSRQGWLLAVFLVAGIPAFCFGLIWLVVNRSSLTSPGRLFRSGRQWAIGELRAATSGEEIAKILADYLASLQRGFDNPSRPQAASVVDTWSPAGVSKWLRGLGFLRSQGQSKLAAELETLAHDCRLMASDVAVERESLIERAIDWVHRVEISRRGCWRSSVIGQANAGTKVDRETAVKTIAKTAAIRSIVCFIACWFAPEVLAKQSDELPVRTVNLDASQRFALLTEANRIYAAAWRDSAGGEEKEEPHGNEQAFLLAAEKYQQLVDSGIGNSALLRNLGNAWYQAGEVGRAIASYRQAQIQSPLSLRVQVNLLLAQTAAGVPWSQYRLPLVAVGLIAFGSVFGWTCLSLRCFCSEHFRRRLILKRLGFSLLVVCLLGGVLLVRERMADVPRQAIGIVDELSIRSGDGESFETTASLASVEGHAFEVIHVRGDWLALVLADGTSGWVHRDEIELIQR